MKRIFFNSLLIICILSVLVFPAFAATTESDDIVILKQPSDQILKYIESSNRYTATVSVNAINVVSYSWEYSTDGINFESLEYLEGHDSNVFTFRSKSLTDPLYLRCKMVGTNGSVVYTRIVYLSHSPANILNFVKSCLNYIIGYVSLIVNSLVTPGAPLYSLLPVLCIGIAVAALLLVIRITKSFSWGA